MSLLKLFKLSCILSFIYLAITANAQENAIGLRGGITPGINFKSYQSNETAYELIIGKKDDGNLITGLFEFHEPASALLRERFRYYYGFGCHLGYYREKNTYTVIDNQGNPYDEEDVRLYAAIGFDGIVGLEYRFITYPFSASVDYKPYINLFGPYRFVGKGLFDIGFSLKYMF